MKIELKELMSDNEMLSHIFLGCIPREKLLEIKKQYVGETDWKENSVKIPIEMKIGDVNVNPKNFFDSWKNQMQRMIMDKANQIVTEKLGSDKLRKMQSRLDEYEQIIESWENDINWDVENPFN